MIEKIKFNNKTDIKISDKFGNAFFMHFGDNLDLYWIPEDFKKASTFFIDEEDKIFHPILNKLFNLIENTETEYFKPQIENNCFTFISEDCHEDDAHRLQIKKEKNQFIIDFQRNENHSISHFPKRGCNICFCNSGSRVPNVEILFMKLYIYLVNLNMENNLNLNDICDE